MEKLASVLFGLLVLSVIAGIIFYQRQEVRVTEARAVTDKGMIQRMKQLELDVRAWKTNLRA